MAPPSTLRQGRQSPVPTRALYTHQGGGELSWPLLLQDPGGRVPGSLGAQGQVDVGASGCDGHFFQPHTQEPGQSRTPCLGHKTGDCGPAEPRSTGPPEPPGHPQPPPSSPLLLPPKHIPTVGPGSNPIKGEKAGGPLQVLAPHRALVARPSPHPSPSWHWKTPSPPSPG